MGQQLAGLLTTKAVIVVLLMNFALPFLEKGAQVQTPADCPTNLLATYTLSTIFVSPG